jgi:hypothetical protein
MNRLRWKTSDLLLLVLFAGLAFAAYRYYRDPTQSQNARLYLSAYLSLLSIATLGSFFARPGWRRASLGYALFGWCNLAFVLWGGFGLTDSWDAERIIEGSQRGVIFGVLTALMATWFLEPHRKREDRE